MQEIHLREGEEFIKLGQLLKAAALVQSGVDAKYAVEEGKVTVNGQVCTMRGKKMHPGDVAAYDGQEVVVRI